MRRAILKISTDLLAQFLTRGTGMTEVIANKLPEGTRIVDIAQSPHLAGVLVLLLESDEFPEVPTGQRYPEIPSPLFRRTEKS